MSEMKTNHSTRLPDDKPLPPPKSVTSGDLGIVGMYAVAVAVLDNVPAMQNYSQELMGISARIGEINEELSQEWINIMDGPGADSDNSKIEAEMASGDDPQLKQVKLNELTVAFQGHSAEYNKVNSDWNSFNDIVNKASSDVSQGEEVVLQFYQYGPKAQIDNLSRLL